VELFFSIERALWVATVLTEALVVVRLVREGLIRKYPLFAAFLMVDVICSILLMQTDIKSRIYAAAFRLGTLVMTVFRLGVVAELYERICGHFPGIGRFRAGMAAVLVLLAALITVFTFRPNLVNQWAFPQTVVVVVQRFQSEILASVLIMTWIFLRYVLSIRQPFSPNILSHWLIATIYFAVSGGANLAALLTGGGNALLPISSAMMAIHLGCFVAWFWLLRRGGEELPAFERLSPDQVETVEHYNQALMRTLSSLPDEISARK
jgi:hypothetical protein